MTGLPTVDLEDLEVPTDGIAGPAYATAIEALAVGLSRHGAVLLRLPDECFEEVLPAGLAVLLADCTHSLPGYKLREWRAGGPPDGAAIQEVGADLWRPGRVSCCGCSQCRHLLLAGIFTCLVTNTKSAMRDTVVSLWALHSFSHLQTYGFLERSARIALSALCRSSLLRLRADAFSEVCTAGHLL